MPVTGAVGLYTPEVERIWREGGQTHVTVGYIPTLSNTASGELSLTAPTEPTKYMDFIFSRGENRPVVSDRPAGKRDPAAGPGHRHPGPHRRCGRPAGDGAG